MGEVIDFRLVQQMEKEGPEDFFELFKSLLRERMPTDDVHLVVAAILDDECYELSSLGIQRLADIYFEYRGMQ